jgi:hypothetical protein
MKVINILSVAELNDFKTGAKKEFKVNSFSISKGQIRTMMDIVTDFRRFHLWLKVIFELNKIYLLKTIKISKIIFKNETFKPKKINIYQQVVFPVSNRFSFLQVIDFVHPVLNDFCGRIHAKSMREYKEFMQNVEI